MRQAPLQFTQAQHLIDPIRSLSKEELIKHLKGKSWDELCLFQQQYPDLISLEEDETAIETSTLSHFFQRAWTRVWRTNPVHSAASTNLHP